MLQCGPVKIMLDRSGRAGGDAGVVLYLYVASARDCHAALRAKGAAPGAVWSHIFTTPGTYRYVCKPHERMGMMATVVVTPA